MNVKLLIILCLLLAACTPTASTPAPTTVALGDMPKQLATVFASPTANDAERQATLVAERLATPVAPPPTPLPSPTVYIGVFMGAANSDEGAPMVDASRFEGTLPAPGVETPTCLIPVDPGFGTNWSVDPAVTDGLGCPAEPAAAYVGTHQLFERGVMYWLPNGEIYTLVLSGDAQGRYWYVPQAPPDQGWMVDPPEGLRMPQLGFGAVWRAVDGVRQAMGFARNDEQPASLFLQRFQGGALLLDSSAGQTFAVVGLNGGTVYGPY